jgi:hypothetical protein
VWDKPLYDSLFGSIGKLDQSFPESVLISTQVHAQLKALGTHFSKCARRASNSSPGNGAGEPNFRCMHAAIVGLQRSTPESWHLPAAKMHSKRSFRVLSRRFA